MCKLLSWVLLPGRRSECDCKRVPSGTVQPFRLQQVHQLLRWVCQLTGFHAIVSLHCTVNDAELDWGGVFSDDTELQQRRPWKRVVGYALQGGRVQKARRRLQQYCAPRASTAWPVQPRAYPVRGTASSDDNSKLGVTTQIPVFPFDGSCAGVPGTYGSNSQLSTPTCSGNCSAGYYCISGSTLPTQFPCKLPTNSCHMLRDSPVLFPPPPPFFCF